MSVRRHAAFAAIAALCLPFAAATAEPREPVQVRVLTADLDLASATGARRLDQRIRTLVARTCASTMPGLAAVRDSSRCRAEMAADARLKIAALRDRDAVRLASAR